MQTLLPIHDQFPIKASPQRDPIPAFIRTTQPASQPFSQIIKDQQQTKTRDLPQETYKTPTPSTNELRETNSNFVSRQSNDAPNRSENGGEKEKFADKLADKSSAIADDARHFESDETNAQEYADTAQSRPAQSAETDTSDAQDVLVEPNNKPKVEDSNQESNDSEIVIPPEIFEPAISSDEVVVESPIHVKPTHKEVVVEPEIPVDNESQTSLPAEPVNSASEPVRDERSSDSGDDRTSKVTVRVSNQSQSSSQTVVVEDNAKTNQVQAQSSQQSSEGNSSDSNQVGANSPNDKHEPISAQPQVSQDTIIPTNARTEDQPVQTDVRPAAPSNSQANAQSNTQANAQVNQTTQVTVGQDQQQASTEDKPAGKGYSEPRTDEPKVKSTSQQQAKTNLPPTQETTSSRSAASARAAQIDAAIRVENATGQPVTVQVQAKPVVQVIPGSVSVTNGAEGQTLNLPNSSADSLQDPAQARILRGLTATLNQRGGVLTMRLDPPDLGQLRIQMSIVKGIVTANFQVQTPQAQALLERSLATLRSALQGQGLTVERLTVQTTPQQTNTQSARHESDQQASQQRQQHDSAQGESRGRRDEQSQDFMSYRSRLLANEHAVFDLNPQPVGAD